MQHQAIKATGQIADRPRQSGFFGARTHRIPLPLSGLIMLLESRRMHADAQGETDIYVSTRNALNANWSDPTPVAELSSAMHERQAWLGPNALVTFFNSDSSAVTESDIVLSTRSSIASAWSAPIKVMELNTDAHDSDPWVSHDLRYMILAHEPEGEPRNIYESSR